MCDQAKRTFRAEVYLKLNSWVNKCGGDRAFADKINEAPRTVRELVYSSPELMKRFGLTKPETETDEQSDTTTNRESS